MAASSIKLTVPMQLKIPKERKVNLKIVLTQQLFSLFEQPYPPLFNFGKIVGVRIRGLK